MSCNCCECDILSIDDFDKRKDVPQFGSTYLQFPAREFFKDAKQNQLISIYVLVRFIGEPPSCFGMGVYKVETANGYEELEGRMFVIGYGRVIEIEE